MRLLTNHFTVAVVISLITLLTLMPVFPIQAAVDQPAAGQEIEVESGVDLIQVLAELLNRLKDLAAAIPLGRVLGVNDNNTHAPGSTKHSEHDALFDMVDPADATHVAVGGNWFTGTAWQGGQVPGDGARVLIPNGVSVTYDGQSDARIKTIRIDGELTFAPNADATLYVDTMVVDPDGTLEIGTQSNPINQANKVEIVFINDGDIDVAWDTQLQSRGLISHGTAFIHGHEKTAHDKVSADPMAGDTSITMAAAPTDWEVGDTIVIAGTHYEGYHNDGISGQAFFPTEDEVRTITAVSGRTISFAEPLIHDHDTPRADLKTSVGNYTRNVVFRSEQGDNTPIHQRGHVMFMHSDDVDVRYAEFTGLGRTDKAGAARNPSEFSPLTSTSNVKGRYSMHFHRLGFNDFQNPVVAEGNAVFGSPGWGYVHHDSNAIFHNNVSYKTLGAGFVAETGNETGAWTDNLAIFAEGSAHNFNPKNGPDPKNFDNGRSGVGYFFQGRHVRVVGNIAASVNTGYNFMHRGRTDNTENGGLDGVIETDTDHLHYQDALAEETVSQGIPTIRSFFENESFASLWGLHVTKGSPLQRNGIKTHMEDFTAWNVWDAGATFLYTGHYVMKDFDVIAEQREYPYKRSTGHGIVFDQNTNTMSLISPRIEGFDAGGIKLGKISNFSDDQSVINTLKQFVVVDPTFINNSQDYDQLDTQYDQLLELSDLEPSRMTIELMDDLLTLEVGPGGYGRAGIRGALHDSVGFASIPPGLDSLDTPLVGYDAQTAESIFLTDKHGYYKNSDGTYWFINPVYASDRVTGEVYKIGVPIKLSEFLAGRIETVSSIWKNAQQLGELNFGSRAPVANNKTVQVASGGSVILDLASGASDPDGDRVSFSEAAEALHGTVYDLGDGRVRYVPDMDYRGQDQFKYWVTDGQGKFGSAYVSIGVGEAPQSSVQKPIEPTYTTIPRFEALPNGSTVSSHNSWQLFLTPDFRGERGASRSGKTGSGVILDTTITPNNNIRWYKVRLSDDNSEGWIPAFTVSEHLDPIRFVTYVEAVSGGGTAPTDSDDDGVPDATDNCRLTANPDQADNDGDGIGNVCDSTPDGEPPAPADDSDEDGIEDGVDNCPSTPNPDQADFDNDGDGDACDVDDDNDGIPDNEETAECVLNADPLCGVTAPVDTDGDTIPDSEDNCPLTANKGQLDFDGDGAGDRCDADDDNDEILDDDEAADCVLNPDPLCGVSDVEAPVMSDFRASDLGGSFDDIRWEVTFVTDKPASAVVKYGTNRNNLTNTVSENSPRLEHSFIFTGLSRKTTYYYEVTVTDAFGNSRTSAVESFSTTGRPSKISNLTARSGE